MNRQKRVLAIHDISCIGKCSLTVAIPIISAAELECAVIPTAVLSTHTGEFTGYTFRDLTDDIEPICEHWRSFGIGFDAIYTGYLGSAKQISLVRSIIDTFGGKPCLSIPSWRMPDGIMRISIWRSSPRCARFARRRT